MILPHQITFKFPWHNFFISIDKQLQEKKVITMTNATFCHKNQEQSSGKHMATA